MEIDINKITPTEEELKDIVSTNEGCAASCVSVLMIMLMMIGAAFLLSKCIR